MKAEKRFRELKIECKAIDEESRTVELAFSSEEPYERSFGIEVLDHEQGSADLSRLHNGAPLLVNHDPNDQMPGSGSGATEISTILFGNFSDLLIGSWNGIDVVVDPYTSAANRQVRLVVSLWTDMAVRHAESFAKCADFKVNV